MSAEFWLVQRTEAEDKKRSKRSFPTSVPLLQYVLASMITLMGKECVMMWTPGLIYYYYYYYSVSQKENPAGPVNNSTCIWIVAFACTWLVFVGICVSGNMICVLRPDSSAKNMTVLQIWPFTAIICVFKEHISHLAQTVCINVCIIFLYGRECVWERETLITERILIRVHSHITVTCMILLNVTRSEQPPQENYTIFCICCET